MPAILASLCLVYVRANIISTQDKQRGSVALQVLTQDVGLL